MKKILIFFLILFNTYFIFNLEKIEAPFVSNITFTVSSGKVLLNWKNPDNFKEYLTIYRSGEKIDTPAKLKNAKKITVLKNSENKYIDIPETDGEFYYSIIITQKSTDEISEILIPFRNYTMSPALISRSELFKIIKFNSSISSNSIHLTWDYESESNSTVKIMIYRYTSPIIDETSLSKSLKIAAYDINSKSHIDNPIPNINYYYAIFIENEKNKEFIPGVNTTTSPAVIIAENVIFPDFSINEFIALPLLTLKNDPKSGKLFLDPQILKNPKKISHTENTKKIIKDYQEQFSGIYKKFAEQEQEKLKKYPVHMLNNEKIFETIEYNLEYTKAISLLEQENYAESLYILEEIFNELLPAELLIRVSYYIGQIYYHFAGHNTEYYKAYIYLLTAYDSFRKEIQPYLDSIYNITFNNLER